MRGKWNHKAPGITQPIPADNTTRYVMQQVRHERLTSVPGTRYGLPIHPEVAMEIAAWFASSGIQGGDLATFASSGTITDDLADNIRHELRTTPGMDSESRGSRDALYALLRYVRACTVTMYVVGRNAAGYLPENDPYAVTLDPAESWAEYGEMLREYAAPEVTRDEGDKCTCVDGSELCEWHAVEAIIGAHLTDDRPGPDGTIGIVIPAESWAGSMSYWIQRENRMYGEFIDEFH